MNDELILIPEEATAFVTGDTADEAEKVIKAPDGASPGTVAPVKGTRDIPPEGAPADSDNAEPSREDELSTLRAELKSLRGQIEEERALLSRMSLECEEFSLLYPGVPLSSLPDSIWESVKKGTPIAAAYALSERRAALARTRADEVNKANSLLSSGSVDSPPTEEFFSPAEVRAMSREQVKANYSKIINSMSKWH